MMYQQTTFGCKRTDSSEDTVDTAESYILIIRALAVSMTLKTEKNTFLLDLLAPNDAPPHQVWLQKVPARQSLKKLSLCCNLDLQQRSNFYFYFFDLCSDR